MARRPHRRRFYIPQRQHRSVQFLYERTAGPRTGRSELGAIVTGVLVCTDEKTMTLEKLVPNFFYVDIADGVRMFVDCLGFEIGHDERTSRQPFCVFGKDGLRINLFQNTEFAKEHSLELRLVTKNIAKVFDKVSV